MTSIKTEMRLEGCWEEGMYLVQDRLGITWPARREQALPQKARENPRVNKEDTHLRHLCTLMHSNQERPIWDLVAGSKDLVISLGKQYIHTESS